jgi:hypothetical protein
MYLHVTIKPSIFYCDVGNCASWNHKIPNVVDLDLGSKVLVRLGIGQYVLNLDPCTTKLIMMYKYNHFNVGKCCDYTEILDSYWTFQFLTNVPIGLFLFMRLDLFLDVLKPGSGSWQNLFFTVFYSQWRLTCWDFVFISYTVKYPGPVQVTVGEPDSNPGQLRPLSGVAQLP